MTVRPQSFDHLVVQRHQFLARLANTIAARDLEPDDLIQATYESAFRDWEGYRSDAQRIATWLGWKMRHAAYMARRARRSGMRNAITTDLEAAIDVGEPARQEDIVYLGQVFDAADRTKHSDTLHALAAGYTPTEIGNMRGATKQDRKSVV